MSVLQPPGKDNKIQRQGSMWGSEGPGKLQGRKVEKLPQEEAEGTAGKVAELGVVAPSIEEMRVTPNPAIIQKHQRAEEAIQALNEQHDKGIVDGCFCHSFDSFQPPVQPRQWEYGEKDYKNPGYDYHDAYIGTTEHTLAKEIGVIKKRIKEIQEIDVHLNQLRAEVEKLASEPGANRELHDTWKQLEAVLRTNIVDAKTNKWEQSKELRAKAKSLIEKAEIKQDLKEIWKEIVELEVKKAGLYGQSKSLTDLKAYGNDLVKRYNRIGRQADVHDLCVILVQMYTGCKEDEAKKCTLQEVQKACGNPELGQRIFSGIHTQPSDRYEMKPGLAQILEALHLAQKNTGSSSA